MASRCQRAEHRRGFLQANRGEAIKLTRTYGSCPVCGVGFFPLDEELGLGNGGLTPRGEETLVQLATFAVSRAYNATQYGMMNGSSDGHSFIVVGPDGRILWRADYGGPPKYTMYVPIPTLVAAIKEGLNGRSS